MMTTAYQQLSPRERQITELVAQSKQNKDIAFRLGLTENTVKQYLNRLFKKRDIHSRVELAIMYVRGEI